MAMLRFLYIAHNHIVDLYHEQQSVLQWNLSKATTLGPKLLAASERWSYYVYAGSTECKRVI